MKRELKSLHSAEFGGIAEKIEACREELDAVKNDMCSNRLDFELWLQEKGKLQQLSKWLKVESFVLRQKA